MAHSIRTGRLWSRTYVGRGRRSCESCHLRAHVHYHGSTQARLLAVTRRPCAKVRADPKTFRRGASRDSAAAAASRVLQLTLQLQWPWQLHLAMELCGSLCLSAPTF